jgi:hypothetical protein
MANVQRPPQAEPEFHEETPEEFAAGGDERHFTKVQPPGADGAEEEESTPERGKEERGKEEEDKDR